MTYLASLKAFNPVLWIRSSRIDLAVQSAALFAMTLGFYPLMKGFVLGQIQTWLTCFFAIAVLAWISGYEFLSGILIGLIISVKPQLAVLLLWGALQRRRKFLVAALLTVLPLELASLWRYGFRNQVDYLSVLSYLAAHGESFFPNQSVNGLLARMLRVGPNLTWMPTAFPPFNVYVYCGTFATSVLMIFLALLWRRKNHAPETSLTKFLMASLLVTMASPIAWEHHYGILISIYAALLPILLKSTNSVRALLGLTVSYLLSSNFFMFTNLVANRHWNFIQSYLFAGALTLIFTVVFLAPKACETAASVESAAQLEAKTS